MSLQELPLMSEDEAVSLLYYYQAIERASQEMLEAARSGNWDMVVRLEGACAVLIARLKQAATTMPLTSDELQLKTRIMQRILVNDAEIRNLAEPWMSDLGKLVGGQEQHSVH